MDAVRDVLGGGGAPIRRRAILGELERRGHMVSLAGLNRALDYARRTGLTEEGPDGVRWKKER